MHLTREDKFKKTKQAKKLYKQQKLKSQMEKGRLCTECFNAASTYRYT